MVIPPNGQNYNSIIAYPTQSDKQKSHNSAKLQQHSDRVFMSFRTFWWIAKVTSSLYDLPSVS